MDWVHPREGFSDQIVGDAPISDPYVAGPNYLTSTCFDYLQEAEKTAGHSSLLADKPDLYEILVDDVKPEKWEEYLKHKSKARQIERNIYQILSNMQFYFHFI